MDKNIILNYIKEHPSINDNDGTTKESYVNTF